MVPKRILLLCAHPDDDAIALGGTIRKFADQGAEITEVVFATGNEGYSRMKDKNRIVKIRAEERKNAGKILGITRYETFDYTDYGIPADETTYKLVIKMIRKYRPDIIFTHYVLDYLSHKSLATIVPEAWWQAGWEASLDLGKPWKAKSLYFFEVLQPLPQISHIVDISDTFPVKIEALKHYQSQHKVVPAMMESVEALAKLRGSTVGVKYGEAFLCSNFIPQKVDTVKNL